VIAAAIAMQVLLALVDGPLRETGDGTVDFEVAGSAERAGEIVDSWRAHDLLANAAFIDGLDFLGGSGASTGRSLSVSSQVASGNRFRERRLPLEVARVGTSRRRETRN
jgi:hypothetical protein